MHNDWVDGEKTMRASYVCNTCCTVFTVKFYLKTDYTTKTVCCPVCWAGDLREENCNVFTVKGG